MLQEEVLNGVDVMAGTNGLVVALLMIVTRGIVQI